MIDRYLAEGVIEVESFDESGQVLAITLKEDNQNVHIIADDTQGLKLIRFIGSRVQVVGRLTKDPEMSVLEVCHFNLKQENQNKKFRIETNRTRGSGNTN